MLKKITAFVLSFLASGYAFASEETEFIDSFRFDRAEYSLKFGGWSSHRSSLTEDVIRKYKNDSFRYNENHHGLGIDVSIPYMDTNHSLTMGAWYMEDSLYKDAYHIGVGYKYSFYTDLPVLESIDANLAITYMNRSTLASNSWFFDSTGGSLSGQGQSEEILVKQVSIERTRIVAPIPYITLNFTKNINIDLMALFTDANYWITNNKGVNEYISKYETVLFMRAGLSF